MERRFVAVSLAMSDHGPPLDIRSGSRLGPYEIVSRIGAGGMGEVWLANDTRLDRSVAVKVLPGEFAGNANLKARFEREAKTISQLNHPHICTLHDVGESDGTNYLVMELLEGETLADKIAGEPLPLPLLLQYGIEIASALERAHRAGVVHRDLKPGNIMITKSGAKLLDFGLAKASPVFQTSGASAASETVQRPLTQEGAIVGTFQYMAPEQLEGLECDARSDIFALGCVLYEMATGRRAFDGKTKTSLIAAIISREPPPVSQLAPMTPPSLEHLIARCLVKEPEERWQSAIDVGEELKWIRDGGLRSGLVAPAITPHRWRSRMTWSLTALVVAGAAAWAGYFFSRPQPERTVSSINAPDSTSFLFDNGAAILSPDGKKLVFSAVGADGRQFLWLRSLESSSVLMLNGTEGGEFPFWSPDGSWIAFFANAELKKMEATGGPAERIAEAPSGRGGAWNRKGQIVFAPTSADPLYVVSESGGAVRPVTTVNAAAGESSHRFPCFLPDGDHFLFYVQSPVPDDRNVRIGSLSSPLVKKLFSSRAAALYLEPGYLLFTNERLLRARPFDSKLLTFKGEAISIVDDVQLGEAFNFANISVSEKGRITYVSGAAASLSRLVRFDRRGKEIDTISPSADYYDPRLSPDGNQVAFAAKSGPVLNVFTYDYQRRVQTRFTFGKQPEWGPVWSPDGQFIAYASFEHSAGDIYIKRASGTEAAIKVVSDGHRKIPSEWSRDGKCLFYHSMATRTGWDLAVYSMADRQSRWLLQTTSSEVGTRLSPNGRWMAYTSNESGQSEIYVQSFHAPGARKWQVSTGGASMPAWSGDGHEIFFRAGGGKMMAARVHDSETTFAVDTPVVLFPVRMKGFSGLSRNQYDVSRDGSTFIINVSAQQEMAPLSVTLVQNWDAQRSLR